MFRLTCMTALTLCSVGGLVAAEPAATWTLTEHLGHRWTRELVFYKLPAGFPLKEFGQVRLVDGKGRELPWQLDVRSEAGGKVVGYAGFQVDLAPMGSIGRAVQ